MSEQTSIYYNHRHIARVTVEAATPIAVGSGKLLISTDSPVIRDVNGLPYIPATSLAGVVRHALEIKDADKNPIFGYHDKDGGLGSSIIFTDAVMVGKEGKPVDGLQNIDVTDKFYAQYREMDIRQHVRISETGVATDTGKFDNEVVCKGTRFTFEMELYSDASQREVLDQVMNMLYSETLRVGSGTRCGYGKLRVVKCERADLDLTQDLDLYLKKSSFLSCEWKGFKEWSPTEKFELDVNAWRRYVVELHPCDFFMFGSGMGDDEADNTPVSDLEVTWDDEGKPHFSERRVLIPATSVKGALAHRTAYHYNKLKGAFADSDKNPVGKDNDAVVAIFGKPCNDKDNKGLRGNIILSDVIGGEMEKAGKRKLFFHIKNDTFTGGTIPGALFQEKCVYGEGDTFTLEILVCKDAWQNEDIKNAFEKSLDDLCDGLLPLGGVTGRGNGMFKGTYNRNENDGYTDR